MRRWVTALVLCYAGAVGAADEVVVYAVQEDYATVRENLEFAITEQGLVINSVMHIGDMLARTGRDLGHEAVYINAESLEFCSADLSYRMMAADPRNITACPYTVAVYVTVAEPETVYLAYRKPRLAGDAAEAESAIVELLDTIARTAADG